jgi:hypothetical protein
VQAARLELVAVFLIPINLVVLVTDKLDQQ